MARALVKRLHNPHNLACGCDADCWCRRTRIGRLVKWWLPARYFRCFGLNHKNSWFENKFKGWSDEQIREWKREQKEILSMYRHQPRYETIVRLGQMRYGMTVRHNNGETVVHELGRARLFRKFR